MFWTIVNRELIDHIMSFRFFAVFALTILLMSAGVMVFSGNYEKAVREYPRWVSPLVDENGKTNLFWVPCNGGARIRRAPSPLAFCSGTGDKELPNQAAIAVHGLAAVERTSEIGEMLYGSIPIDWAFVVSVVLSFAAGLLTYKGISGERRDGTLTLTLSNPLSKATLLLAKYFAAILALAIAFTAAACFGIITLEVMGKVQLTGDDWLKIGLFGLASLVYLSIFVLIGLICSVFTQSPVISAVAFLFSWAMLVFVIPNLGGIVTGLVENAKTPYEITKMSESIRDKYPLNPGISFEREAAVKLEREKAREDLLIEYVQSLTRQVTLGQDITRISPASAFSYAAENISGGGTHRLMRFIDNVVRYREGLLGAMIEADKEDTASQHRYVPWRCGGSNFSHRTVDLGQAKEFRDVPPSSTEGLKAAFWDLFLLILYNMVAFAIAFWRFARQDVAPTPGV
jgi:ABC-type transport system involved in multi-copper enzyme maturation permease subunit